VNIKRYVSWAATQSLSIKFLQIFKIFLSQGLSENLRDSINFGRETKLYIPINIANKQNNWNLQLYKKLENIANLSNGFWLI